MLRGEIGEESIPMARPMPLFAPVTTATRDWDAILNSYGDGGTERKTSCVTMNVVVVVITSALERRHRNVGWSNKLLGLNM